MVQLNLLFSIWLCADQRRLYEISNRACLMVTIGVYFPLVLEEVSVQFQKKKTNIGCWFYRCGDPHFLTWLNPPSPNVIVTYSALCHKMQVFINIITYFLLMLKFIILNADFQGRQTLSTWKIATTIFSKLVSWIFSLLLNLVNTTR